MPSYTGAIFDAKISQLCEKIKQTRQFVTYFDSADLRPFTQLVNDELAGASDIIKRKEADLTVFNRRIQDSTDIREDAKRSFSQIMDALGSQEIRLTKLDRVLSQLCIWKSQREDSILSVNHRLLAKFTDEMSKAIGLKTPVITNFGTEFRSTPCARFNFSLTGYIANVPETVVNQFGVWSILAHEIGHAYYHENYSLVKQNIGDQLELHIRSLPIPEKDDQYMMIQSWKNDWIPELVSDYVGVIILGPAYAEQILVDAFGDPPRGVASEEDSHPPWNIRMKLVIQALDKLALEDYSFHEQKRMWEEYENIFVKSVDPIISNLLTNEKTTKKAMDLIFSSITLSPIQQTWSDVLRIKKRDELDSFSISSLITSYSLEKDLTKKEILQKAILAKH